MLDSPSDLPSPPGQTSLAELVDDFWRWRCAQAPRTRDDIPRLERPAAWRPAWSGSDVSAMRRSVETFERRLAALGIAAPPAGGAGAAGEAGAAGAAGGAGAAGAAGGAGAAGAAGDAGAAGAAGGASAAGAAGAAAGDYVDARLLASAIGRVRFELDVVPLWRRDPWFYLDQSVGTVFEALLRPPPFGEERLEELWGLLDSFAATLQAGRENLAGNVSLELAGIARAVAPGAGRNLTEALEALAPDLASPAAARLRHAAAAAAGELDAYASWLEAEAAHAHPLGAPGRDVLERYLYDVALVGRTPEELLDAGRRELDRAMAFELFELHRCPDATWPPLPASAEAQCEAEAAAELEVRRFYEGHRLLSQPAGLRHYLNSPLPGWLAPLRWLGVTDDLTGPSRLDEDGVSYVPPPAPDLPYFYRANAADPRAGIVHEGAHYQQLALTWAHPRPARRFFYDSCPNEGIAFYNEEMLLQAGLFDDAPITRRIMCSFLRLRALRVEVDLRLALGEWSISEGGEVLASRVPMDRGTAFDEAAFFASTPFQGSSYLAGKVDLLALLADARLAGGEGFELQAFHDALWKNGNVPFSLQRLELLGDASQLARVDELRAKLDLAAPLVSPVPR